MGGYFIPSTSPHLGYFFPGWSLYDTALQWQQGPGEEC